MKPPMSGLPLLYSSSNQLGWITQVLPFFEQENVYSQYDITLPWFDAATPPCRLKESPCWSARRVRFRTSTRARIPALRAKARMR